MVDIGDITVSAGNTGNSGAETAAIVAALSGGQAQALEAERARRGQTTKMALLIGGGLLAGLALFFLIGKLMQ